MKQRLYCSMDLHSNNVVIVVTDPSKKTLLNTRVSNDLPLILDVLEPFQPYLPTIAIESTYNWYWLVDGLEDHGYSVDLVNTAAVRTYDGAKYTDDSDDAQFLCDLQIMDRLPTGYVYPRKERPVRDMLRRRSLFIRHRTSQTLSVQGLFARQTGKKHSVAKIAGYDDETLLQLLGDASSVLMTDIQCETRSYLSQQIAKIEKFILGQVKLKPRFVKLQTIPGVGTILGLTIMLETGNIGRFEKCGKFVSYCRCAPSKRISNNKVKGKNNTKNGNPYLSWAFIEAAAHAIGCCAPARKYYDRKLRRSQSTSLAMKSVAAKLAKAAYFIMKNDQEFILEKAF
jgi:transposase